MAFLMRLAMRSWSDTAGAGVGAAVVGATASGLTSYGFRLFFDAVNAIVIFSGMWDRWLMRMPPTSMPAHVTFSSRYSVMLLPIHVAGPPQHLARTRPMLFPGR